MTPVTPTLEETTQPSPSQTSVSSVATIPIPQSELITSSVSSSFIASQDGFPSITTFAASQTPTISTPTTTRTAQVQSSAEAGISSSTKFEAAPVVGGVLGSIALIAVIGGMFWFCRRRRRRRGSSLTPLNTGEQKSFYEIDRESVGPTKRSVKWRAEVGYHTKKLSSVTAGFKSNLSGIGSFLKSKVIGDRSDTPSVNLNRGNSQFLDGSVPQHSRNNSVHSDPARLPVLDRFSNWWDRFTDNVVFNWRLRRQAKEPVDPFDISRGMTEKGGNPSLQPDFPQLLGDDNKQVQPQADKRFTNPTPSVGSLGVNFVSRDPFADPVVAAPAKSENKAWIPPHPGASNTPNPNPFADPIAQPQRSIPKSQSSVSDIRQYRGQSVNISNNNRSAYAANNAAYRPPSTTVASRYPSSITQSRDSYRDTVFSAFSSNGRKGKGRSDPFDLERPELWQPKDPRVPDTNRTIIRPRGNSMADRESASLYPDPLSTNPTSQMSSLRGTAVRLTDSNVVQPRVVSLATSRVVSNATYGSKYSSGVSSLGGWGDPGPDLGPGNSSKSSLRGNASSDGSTHSTHGAANARAFDGNGGDVITGLSSEIQNGGNEWDRRSARDGFIPISLESDSNSTIGVGKAI